MTAWHIVTSEYPPQVGGVSDYVGILAAGLAERGDEVHVWAPNAARVGPEPRGVTVHRVFGSFSMRDILVVEGRLNDFAGPRRLFVQWVPHGYARDSVNLAFCWWLLWRARVRGDRVELMVHEAYLPFRRGAHRQNAAAIAHRVMAAILLMAASKVWYSIPTWQRHWRPYYLGRRVPSQWLPLPSTVPLDLDGERTEAVRARYLTTGGQLLGHFGTFGRDLKLLLLEILTRLPADLVAHDVLLIGPGGEGVRDELVAARPDLDGRVHATGVIPAIDLAPYLAACDVMLQPYTDGVTSRRTTFMACLALGRPTVTTLGKHSEDLWAESGAAVLCAPSDVDGLANATAKLLHEPAQRRALGAAAARLYADRFHPRHIIDALRGEVPG